jgi:23S rRNA (uridine2552-2'-O)-methyltransferase
MKQSFDLVLSDMAPNTTGNRNEDAEGSIELCTEVLAIAAQVLKPKGNLVMVFFTSYHIIINIATSMEYDND